MLMKIPELMDQIKTNQTICWQFVSMHTLMHGVKSNITHKGTYFDFHICIVTVSFRLINVSALLFLADKNIMTIVT